MEKVFRRFKEFFEERYSRISVLDMGEDSVRYDFFSALMDQLQLNPWQIQLEYPLHSGTFYPRKNEKRKRDEKPQIDLYVELGDRSFCVEFAFFKRNKVDGSPGNDTEYAFKILNDLMRLGLQSYSTNSEAYFVCVADEIMLGKQLWSKKLPKFPADTYKFNHPELVDIMEDYKSAKKIDERFLKRFAETNLTITAKKVFDEVVQSGLNTMQTRALVWKISI
jgi:hypothetical protein